MMKKKNTKKKLQSIYPVTAKQIKAKNPKNSIIGAHNSKINQ
jgi:hypothetical protein